MDKKRMRSFLPALLVVAIAASAGAGAITLWISSVSMSVELKPSQFTTIIYSDDGITPITALSFGVLYSQYSGPSTSEWKNITLILQTLPAPNTKLYIKPSLVGVLPTGASFEISREKFDLTWESTVLSAQGFFSTQTPGSPLINGLCAQRWKVRLVFSAGSPVGIYNTFGISYEISDITNP